MERAVWILIFSLLLATFSVKGQDDEDEDEDEDNYEEESSAVKAKEESGRLTDAPAETTTRSSLSLAQVNNLTKLLSQSQDGGNGSMNQALMSMLLLAALSNPNNANRQEAVAASTSAPVTTAVPEVETEEPSSTTREEFVVGQVGKILDSVMRANISGIVDNAVRIGAPPSVITMMGNILTALNNWTGGVFGLRRETTPQPAVNCRSPPPTSTVRQRQPQPGQMPRPRPPISPAASGGAILPRIG